MPPFRGVAETTVGIVPVVKVHTKLLARPVPAGFVAAVVIVAVYSVLAARAAVGVKVAVVPEYVTAPATAAAPGPDTVKVDVLIVIAFIAVLKVAVITAATGTLVPWFKGAVAVTAGPTAAVPHPAAKPAIRNASAQIFRTL